jgi:hypothetical protein
MRRVFALLGLSAALVVAWLSLFPSQAVATIEGPCTASIDKVDVTNGHDAPDSAVPLQSGTKVPVAGTAQDRVTDLSYTVHVAGGGVQVGSVVIAQDGLSWKGTVDLEKISNATVGLFEVTADVETTGASCSRSRERAGWGWPGRRSRDSRAAPLRGSGPPCCCSSSARCR